MNRLTNELGEGVGLCHGRWITEEGDGEGGWSSQLGEQTLHRRPIAARRMAVETENADYHGPGVRHLLRAVPIIGACG